jgi:MurNAc alpha-1-phosphate uridylyltransferase
VLENHPQPGSLAPAAEGEKLTFAGIGVYRAELLAGHPPGKFGIVPVLRAAMRANRISGGHFRGAWSDIGTPQRLAELDARLRGRAQAPLP